MGSASVTLRRVKGIRLTHEEVDDNFDSLKNGNNDNDTKLTSHTGPGDDKHVASAITYNNGGFTNVSDALDSILYNPASITAFTNSLGSLVEMGAGYSTIGLDWTVDMGDSLSIGDFNLYVTGPETANIQIANNLTNYDYIGSNPPILVSGNVNFQLSVTDDHGRTSSRSTSVTFTHKRFWGKGDFGVTVTDEEIETLDSELSQSRVMTKTFLALNNEYIYFAFPASWGDVTFWFGGLETPFTLTTQDYTNVNGWAESYRIYKSVNQLNGGITVEVRAA